MERKELDRLYRLVMMLSVEEKKKLIDFLNLCISREQCTWLQERWQEILRLIDVMKYESYLSNQEAVDRIWIITAEVSQSEETEHETWEVRQEILDDIIDHNGYKALPFGNDLEYMVKALILSEKEALYCADRIRRSHDHPLMNLAALLYKENGRKEEYIECLENMLDDDPDDYLEVMRYYKDRDYGKMMQIGEEGLENCYGKDFDGRYDNTDIMIFMIRSAIANGDEKLRDKLLERAKTQHFVWYDRIQKEFGIKE